MTIDVLFVLACLVVVAMLQERMRRASAPGQELPAAARRSMDRLEHERGGRLRIEIERSSERDPTPERFREILATAVEIAALNARINPAPSAKL